MEKEKEYKKGEKLVIPREKRVELLDLAMQDNIAEAEFLTLMAQTKGANAKRVGCHRKLWTTIEQIFPGLESYKASYNAENHYIVIKDKKSDDDECSCEDGNDISALIRKLAGDVR